MAVKASFPAKKTSHLPLLLTGLALVSLAYPVSRFLFVRTPSDPASNAPELVKMAHYARRIEENPADRAAYLSLGKLEEANGYFFLALKHLYAARVLGASDQETAPPIGRSLNHLGRADEAKPELEKAAAAFPDSAEAAANLAGLYDEDGQPQKASQILRHFLEQHPALLNAAAPAQENEVERLTFCFAQIGDDEMTLKTAGHLITLAPDKPVGYALAGKAALALNRPQKAADLLKKAVQLAPREAATHYNYGVALALLGDHDTALHEWQQTIMLNRGALEAYYRLTEEYTRRKQYAEAAFAASHAAVTARNNPQICELAASFLEKAGNHVEADYWKATAAGLKQDFAASLRLSQKVLASSSDPAWKKRALAGIAEAYRGMKRNEDYLKTIRQIAVTDSVNDDLLMATAYDRTNNTRPQIEFLKKALKKDPSLAPMIHAQLAEVAKLRGDRDDAEREMLAALAIRPNDTSVLRALGNLYFERRNEGDRLNRAIEVYEKAAHLNPQEALEFQHLGLAYAAAENWRRAAHNLEHSIDLQPGHGPSYKELGRVYEKMGDKSSGEQMIALYKKYVAFDMERQTLFTRARNNKTDPLPLIELGDFQFRAGDLTQAADLYERAYKLKPKDAPLRDKLYRTYGRLGRTDAQIALGQSFASSSRSQTEKHEIAGH